MNYEGKSSKILGIIIAIIMLSSSTILSLATNNSMQWYISKFESNVDVAYTNDDITFIVFIYEGTSGSNNQSSSQNYRYYSTLEKRSNWYYLLNSCMR